MTVVGYPPEHHLLRDLALEFEHGEGESRAWVPVDEHLLDAHGFVRAGVLATLVDVMGGGLAAIAAAPGWIATADLTLHTLAPVHAGRLAAVGRVVRRGRTTVVIETDVADGAGVGAAAATMTFSVLERRESNPTIAVASGAPQRQHMAQPSSGFTIPLLDALRITDRADGAEVTPHTYIANSLGGVQGGVVATLADRAAEVVAGRLLDGPARVVDLQVTYLALCKAGPIVARAEPTGQGADRVALHVDITDEGVPRLAAKVRASAVRVAS